MRPACDVFVGRSRKDPEATTPAHPVTNITPTSFFIATEDMLRRPNRESVAEGSESTFGVESLEETVCNVANVDENEKNDSDGHEDRKYEGRRRSTLKPMVRDRDSSPESLERALQDRAKDASVSHSSVRPTSAPSASESMTSLSQVSQSQGLSLPSSPKSTSTRSFRPSDEESMDEVASQAIVSSEEEEDYSVSELQDSAPQLIMPSIKMPSRRPFTEKGKGTGRLKILIAGDSGMIIYKSIMLIDMLRFIKGLARHLSSSRSFKLVKTSFMWIHYPRVSLSLTNYDHEDPKADMENPTQIQQNRSQRFMRAPELTHHGGQKLTRAKFFGSARASANLSWKGMSALLILLVMAVPCP